MMANAPRWAPTHEKEPWWGARSCLAVSYARARWGATWAALALFTVSAWRANSDVCPGCMVEPLTLRPPGAAEIAAQLYLPPVAQQWAGRLRPPAGLPAVILVHGYLANGAFLERPWVKDLTARGYATLVLDRRGAGNSDGDLWLRPQPAPHLDDVAPDIRAAIAELRTLQPVVDADRLAIFGHSDGATAALEAASADWAVRATVAVSASVAPGEFVNHVAPQDLLLIYGAEDRFVLNDTRSVVDREEHARLPCRSRSLWRPRRRERASLAARPRGRAPERAFRGGDPPRGIGMAGPVAAI